MIRQRSILSGVSLFVIVIILISAYATDVATSTTTANSSTKVNTYYASTSDNYGYGGNRADSVLYDKINASGVQARVTGHVDDGIVDDYRNTSVEINKGNESLSWNYTMCNSQKYGDNGYGTLSILSNLNSLNFTKKVDVTPILDAIGQEEAQFGNVQHVTIYGIDDASVIEYYGYGDCWADSCWLYNKLTSMGIPVRIMGYEDGGWGDGYRHTWIEINIGNGWQTWNYTKYNSQHAADNGYGTPFVLIEPGNAPADVMKTGY